LAKEDYLRRSPIRFDDADYQACYEYWLSIKGDKLAPTWSQWSWMELPTALIPYFLVVDVRQDPVDFVFRFWGAAYVTMHGIDMTGMSVREIRSSVTAKNTFDQYLEVLETRQAIGSSYTVQAGENGLPYVQTSLRMPVSNDGENVDMIITFADWRKDRKQIRDEHIQTYG